MPVLIHMIDIVQYHSLEKFMVENIHENLKIFTLSGYKQNYFNIKILFAVFFKLFICLRSLNKCT